MIRRKSGWLVLGLLLLVAAGPCDTGKNTNTKTPDTQPSPTTSATPSDSPLPSATPTTPSPPPPPPIPTIPAGIPAEALMAKVERHVDGDTIWASGGTLPVAAVSRIRLLEVDTPESTTQVDCFGPEGSAFTKKELPIGSTVYLLADRQDTDRYARFLRYIWKADGSFFNETLVREGYAKSLLIMPNDRFIGRIRAAEAEARKAGRGLWKACVAPPPAPVPVAPAPQPVQPAPQPAPGGNCDASYPDFCIPPSPPDLDCPDIPQKNFTVQGADAHRFDADHDGIGCEAA